MTTTNPREYIYQGYTLVDITDTNVTKFSPERARERKQQRNWETVQQLLGLRSQVLDIKQIKLVEDVNKHEFGSAYKDKHTIWMFEFTVEFDAVYNLNNNPVGTLTTDFHHSPITTELDETATFELPLFYTDGENKNIYFKSLT